jgi:thiamine-monophosphate kinase
MESDFIAWLRGRVLSHPQLRLGPGDDAAILRLGGDDCVVTVDLVTDGVDFELAKIDPRRAGRKALAVSLSDLAAMAAKPVAAFVAVALPRSGGMELAQSLYEGMAPLATRYRTAIAGGDTNSWDGPLVISTTAIGAVTERGPLVRSGAKLGDRIIVTGDFGGSILGKHLDFEPRIEEALLLNERYTLHAGIDCSDGLSLDLSRLAAVSGCGAVLHLSRLPISPAARQLAATEKGQEKGSGVFFANAGGAASTTGEKDSQPLRHALSDGEDFELIVAVPPDDAARMIADQPLSAVLLTDIGEFIAEPGLWETLPGGQRRPLPPRGFEHALD